MLKGGALQTSPLWGYGLLSPSHSCRHEGSREMPQQEGPLAVLILVFCCFFAFKNETNMEKRTRGELVCWCCRTKWTHAAV